VGADRRRCGPLERAASDASKNRGRPPNACVCARGRAEARPSACAGREPATGTPRAGRVPRGRRRHSAERSNAPAERGRPTPPPPLAPYVAAVYAFALILATYLAATFVGSSLYRRRARATARDVAAPLAALSAVAGLLPALAADPRFGDDSGLAVGAFRVVLGIGPLCVALGALTPMLVDRFSGGDGARAGRAYAVNVVGCILGPLVAGFALLPALAERWCLLLLAAPVAALAAGPPARRAGREPAPWRRPRSLSSRSPAATRRSSRRGRCAATTPPPWSPPVRAWRSTSSSTASA
jgi:hypothetical protein